jgi:hypothetical protein
MEIAGKFRKGNVGWVSHPASKAQVLAEAHIVKYHPNRYYGELNSYLDNNWVKEGEYIVCRGQRIPQSLFESKESHYVIAFVRRFPDENSTQIEGVEDRILYLEDQDKRDFFDVYAHADKWLQSLDL